MTLLGKKNLFEVKLGKTRCKMLGLENIDRGPLKFNLQLCNKTRIFCKDRCKQKKNKIQTQGGDSNCYAPKRHEVIQEKDKN